MQGNSIIWRNYGSCRPQYRPRSPRKIYGRPSAIHLEHPSDDHARLGACGRLDSVFPPSGLVVPRHHEPVAGGAHEGQERFGIQSVQNVEPDIYKSAIGRSPDLKTRPRVRRHQFPKSVTCRETLCGNRRAPDDPDPRGRYGGYRRRRRHAAVSTPPQINSGL